MKKTQTFMGVTTLYDPVQHRNKMEKKAKKGLLTGRGYWAGLKASWPEMTQNDKDEEHKLLKGGMGMEMLKKKEAEVKKQIWELLNNVKPELYKMVGQAGKSGALSEEMKEMGNYLLAKAIICIYFDHKPFGPSANSTKKEFENLSHFI